MGVYECDLHPDFLCYLFLLLIFVKSKAPYAHYGYAALCLFRIQDGRVRHLLLLDIIFASVTYTPSSYNSQYLS